MIEVDYQDKESVIEAKSGVSATRDLRDALFKLVHLQFHNTGKEVYLLLQDPGLSSNTIRREFDTLQRVLKPEIASKIQLVIARNNELEDATGRVPEWIHQHLKDSPEEGGRQFLALPRPDMKSEVFRVLLLGWIRGRESMTTEWITRKAGCSYRTAARTIESLEPAIVRHSDRSVGLKYFPHDDWRRFAVNAKKARATLLYTDRSGQPRSPESLLNRIASLQRDDVALGGVPGARSHDPHLDMAGTPSLDITIHAHRTKSVDFPIRKIDPALEPVSRPDQPVALAVHFLRRKETYFEDRGGPLPIADPVECLLDLIQARLSHQAQEFMTHLIHQGEGRRGGG